MPKERDSDPSSREEGDSPSQGRTGSKSARLVFSEQRPRDPDEDLIDPSPPPPDKPVIAVPSREEHDRSWLLRAVVVGFGADIVLVLALGSFLSPVHWKQVEPVATRSIELLAPLATLIIGFYFAKGGKS